MAPARAPARRSGQPAQVADAGGRGPPSRAAPRRTRPGLHRPCRDRGRSGLSRPGRGTALTGSLPAPAHDQPRDAREAEARPGPAAARDPLRGRGRRPGPRPHRAAVGSRPEEVRGRRHAAPAPGYGPGSRHVPAEVKRAVFLRDLGRCAFVGTGSRRCAERGFLEFHHVRPFAMGGEATVGNIQLRCRRHNDLEARADFGRDAAVRSFSARTAGPVGGRRSGSSG